MKDNFTTGKTTFVYHQQTKTVEILNDTQPRCEIPLNDLLRFSENWIADRNNVGRAASAGGESNRSQF